MQICYNRLGIGPEAIEKAELPVIDELGYLPGDIEGIRLLFQAIADSYETRSVVSTLNPESGRWGDVFGDGGMAAATGERIVHHGRTVRFHGESYRNTHSPVKQPNNTNRKPDSPNRPERTTKLSRKSDDTVQVQLD
ncbi:ATPase AAA [Bifidobacterium thermophilum]|uniref:ATPase AAA n=1 Tax=Bifidobacterium thermophilum TaxID=33905 RepID=A0A2N3QPE4_9BIFI|nr:ATPase AAA [Bifidobacterium thermophilum]